MNNLINNSLNGTLKHTKRVIVTVVGFTVLFIGIAMIILPGPAFIVIPLGLAILAGEFVWAKKLLHKVKTGVEGVKESFKTKQKDKNS